MRPPAFWYEPSSSLAPRLLAPLSWITAQATSRRLSRPGWRAPVPVICCGNVGVGGAGKTTLALDLLRRLRARGIDAHALTRGYAGTAKGVMRVEPSHHDALCVGDEALLLAASATTWLSADRAASAQAAIAQGAQCLVMDDGMQNTSLAQDCTLIVIDGAVGFGNARLLPAGPLREPIATAVARADAAILIGADRRHALRRLPSRLPILRATLALGAEALTLHGRKVSAFAGIGRPEKFFASLDEIGLDVVERRGFADHHRYRDAELDRLAMRARLQCSQLVTTSKDAARLPANFLQHVVVLSVALHWAEETLIETLLDELFRRCKAETKSHKLSELSPYDAVS